jgi:hypothetical protein
VAVVTIVVCVFISCTQLNTRFADLMHRLPVAVTLLLRTIFY